MILCPEFPGYPIYMTVYVTKAQRCCKRFDSSYVCKTALLNYCIGLIIPLPSARTVRPHKLERGSLSVYRDTDTICAWLRD